MVLGKLIGEEVRRHRSYCKERSIWPITVAKGVTVQEGDSNFSDLSVGLISESVQIRDTGGGSCGRSTGQAYGLLG